MIQKLKKHFEERPQMMSWGRIWTVVAVLAVILIATGVGLFSYTQSYKNRVLPGVQLAGVPIGGMRAGELRQFINASVDKLISEGWTVKFTIDGTSNTFILSPVLVANGETIELASVDVDAEVDTIIAYGKDGDMLRRMQAVLHSRVVRPMLRLQYVSVRNDQILADLAERLSPYEIEPKNAHVVISNVSPLSYSIVSSTEGIIFDTHDVPNQIITAWSELRVPTLDLSEGAERSVIHEDDVSVLVDRLPFVFNDGDLTITYVHPTYGTTLRFPIRERHLRDWLTVGRVDDTVSFVLDEKELRNFIETSIIPSVTIKARDAKFSADENGKVTECQGSRAGISVDIDETVRVVQRALASRTHHDGNGVTAVALVTKIVEPNIRTGDVNNLGITEVLGIVVSNFSGSPTNRIRNIRNGVNKLNGVLIKPGEVFSAIEYTKPYTLEGGYLPELVIKGDEIKPEIGGGLCQIGTTLFRMAMNSAMEIEQRRNHSLVVNYYNDLENGLPGTDATIYEPAPDFQFRNDTENYVLIQTDMDVNTGYLTFTLWGTNDGRKGSYSKPVVHRWIQPGETKEVPSTKLAPGERTCQHKYIGAETSFTYSRTMPDGSLQEEVFESYYRPLPQICLVGIGSGTESSDSEVSPGSVNATSDEEAPIVIE